MDIRLRSTFATLTLAAFASAASAQWPIRTVAQLDTAHCTSGELENKQFLVSDGLTEGDVSTGGGSVAVLAVCDAGAFKAAAGADLSAYVLLAGDADGQTIQGTTGANQPRVAMDTDAVTIYGDGATPPALSLNDSEASLNGSLSGGATINQARVTSDGFLTQRTDSSTYDSQIYSLGTEAGISTWGILTLRGDAGIVLTTVRTPPTDADDPCTAGEIIPTATFLYFCSATDTWVRVAMATW